MDIFSAPHFRDGEAARKFLEGILWPDGRVCPHCGVIGHAYETKRPGVFRCAEKVCHKDFTVTMKTVMERSHIALHKWLQGFHLMASSKKGISAHQLHRSLDITYKSAWFMAHRIREAMALPAEGGSPMGGEGKTVEADETVVGGKERNKRLSKRNPKNIGAVGKQIAFTLVERNGRARSFHVANVTGKTLAPIIFSNVRRESALMTDDAGQYRPIGREFARFETVNHG